MKSARLILSAYLLAHVSALWASHNPVNDLKQKELEKPVGIPHLNEQDYEGKTAAYTINDLPPEVIQYILSFTHISDFTPLTYSSPIFANAARDKDGPFKDFIQFKAGFRKHYGEFKAASDENLFSSFVIFLGQVRAQSNVLFNRSLDDQQTIVSLFTSLLEKNIQSFKDLNEESKTFFLGAPTMTFNKPPTQGIKPLLASIALFRAWDSRLTGFKNQIIELKECFLPYNYRVDSPCPYSFIRSFPEIREQLTDCFILSCGMGEFFIYTDPLDYKDRNSTKNSVPFQCATKLSHLSEDAANTVMKYAYHYGQKSDKSFLLYTIALCENYNQRAADFLFVADYSFKLENWTQAVEYYDIAFKKNPELDAYNYANAGLCNAMLGNYTQAAEYYSIALGKKPELDAYNYANAGLCNAMLGNYTQAEEYYKTASEKSPALLEKGWIRNGLIYDNAEYCTAEIKKTLENIATQLNIANRNAELASAIMRGHNSFH